MSHFTRERSDQDWYRGLKVPHTVLRNIDEKTRKAVSESGGSWAPSSPITIGGAGIELQCSTLLSTAVAQPGTGKVFRFGDDYFKFESSRSRLVTTAAFEVLGNYTLGREARPWMVGAPALRMKRAGAFLRLPLRIPDGSRLESVEMGYRVGQAHASVPAVLPKMRVVRMTADGTVEPMPNPTSTAYDKGGWVSPELPVSGAAWYDSGNAKTLTATFDYEANDPCDTSVYAYAVEFKDESGTGAYTDAIGTYLFQFRATVHQSDLRPF